MVEQGCDTHSHWRWRLVLRIGGPMGEARLHDDGKADWVNNILFAISRF